MIVPTSIANAAELFGIQLKSASHDDLSAAAKQAGVSLIREGGETLWFDVFDSQAVLSGSSRLYLGYVKKDRLFAFAEYEFIGLKRSNMLAKLTQKYGKPRIMTGKFISDNRYRWQINGIDITLATDWSNFRTRLNYVEPIAMAKLKQEQLQAEIDTRDSDQVAF